MHYKAVAAAGASVLLIASLTACTNSTGGGTAADGSITLTWATNSSEREAADAVIAAYKEVEPDVTISVTTADTDNYQTTLRTQLSSGTAPDVFFTWAGDGNPMAMKVLEEADLILDLSDRPFVPDIPAGIQPVTQIDGSTYIAPITYSGIGAAYNMTAVDAAGLQVPTTWTELLGFCADARSQGKSAFALAAGTPWNTQLIPYALTPTLVYGPDPEFASQMAAGDVTFADSDWVEAFDKYTEMQDAGCFQDGDLGTVYEDALGMVSRGEAFASVQVNASLAAMTAGAPEGTEFGFEPLPATDDASETRMAGAAGAAYAVNANSDVQDAAVAFVDWLASPEGSAVYSTAAKSIPAIPNSDFETDPVLDTFVQYQLDGKTDPFMDQLWPNSKVQQIHFEVLQQLLGGSLTAEQALEQMDAAYAEGA